MAKADKAKASKSTTVKTVTRKKGASITRTPNSKKSKTEIGMKEFVQLTPEFVADLKEVFAKHNWSGHPVGFVANPAAASLGAQPCDPGPSSCPGGEQPLQQWVHCPDGTSILRNFCP
jgi:hypothetical protein